MSRDRLLQLLLCPLLTTVLSCTDGPLGAPAPDDPGDNHAAPQFTPREAAPAEGDSTVAAADSTDQPLGAGDVPIANAGGPYFGVVNTPVVFDGTASDAPHGSVKQLTFSWSFGDDSTATGPTPSHTYTAAGVYTVTLVVADRDAPSAPASTTVVIEEVSNHAPVASPGGPYSGVARDSIQFDGSASSDPDADLPLTYTWDFGDGRTGTGVAPKHAYSAGRSYTVTLTVTDAQGLSSAPAAVTAEIARVDHNRLPIANPGGPYHGSVNVPLTFDGTASSDPNGPENKLTYAWSFGDGATGTGPVPSHTYTAAGTYTLELVVTDMKGAISETASTSVTITDLPNVAPVAVPGGPYSGVAGTPVQFDGSASSDPDGNLPVTYAWDFGDGSTGTGATPSHSYAAAGTFTVTLTVTDARGLGSAAAITSAAIEAANQPPLAAAGGPYTGLTGTAVQFDGSASSDPDAHLPLTYAWDFGDGDTGTGATPSHTYAEPGAYTVTLTVTDANGLTSTLATTIVTIEAPNRPPVATAAGPYTTLAGNSLQFDGSASADPDAHLPLTYNWDFGDGTTGTGATPSHTYDDAGVYTVTLIVTDASGLSSPPATTLVTVASPIVMLDSFSRTVAQGWGNADIGGGWFTSNTTNFSVDGQRGIITASAAGPINVVGRGPVHGAPDMPGYALDVGGLVSFRVDTPPDGTAAHTVQVYARRNDRVTDGDNYYRFRVRLFNDRIETRIEKTVANIESFVTAATTTAVAFDPSARWWIRWEVFGTSPATTLRMRVWRDGTLEPTAWHSAAVIDEPALDLSGTTGFRFALPSGQVTLPVRLEVDDLRYLRKNLLP